MLSKYFEITTNTQKFKDDLLWSLGEIKDKKILLYGAGEGFVELNKTYHFNELNVVAIADMKFKSETTFMGMKAINPENIVNEDYDVVLIINEYANPILNYLMYDLNIQNKDIRTVFNEQIHDEQINLNYLYEFNFDKTLPKLIKKIKDKKVVLYGAGAFLEVIKKYFDISQLNVIGVSDIKYEQHAEGEEFLGYKAYSPDEIKELNPDYVIIATKRFIEIMEDLYYNKLKGSKIKIKPIIKKPFLTLVKEIWG